LRVRHTIELKPGSRFFLRDLDASRTRRGQVLAAACKTLLEKQNVNSISYTVEGVGKTTALVLMRSSKPPRSITLSGQPADKFNYSAADGLIWIRFVNEARPRELKVNF
jgi:hypothetical protein